MKDTDLLDKQNAVPEEIGNIKIADEVISIVASLAAQEVPGVLDMGGGLAEGFNELIGKRKRYRGVRMQVDGRVVDVAVYVFVQSGAWIPEIALGFQSKV